MTSSGSPSLAVLLDNARASLFAASEAGLETKALFISADDYDALQQTALLGHHRERPLRILGVEVLSRPGLAVGAVQLAADHELPTAGP